MTRDFSNRLLVSADQLGRRFGSRWVVRDLNLDLGAGERHALSGSNGSGKSTIIRCIAGTLALTEGCVIVAGFRAGSRAARSMTGVSLAHERAFYLRLSGRDNLVFFARARGMTTPTARAVVSRLADELELPFVDERAGRYSAGMLQQLSIARALLGNSPVLIFDEPTRSLDEEARARFWAALDRRKHAAVVLATHRRDDIDRCTSVTRLRST